MIPSEISELSKSVVDEHVVRNTRSIISDLFYGIRLDTFKCLKCDELIEKEPVSLISI